jgi:NADH-quinone oxidoreductase subunit M
VSSIILAALLLKLGGYGLIKFLIPGFSIDISLYYRPIILFLCLIGFIYGSLCATRQIDLKRQIAFSSVAHMSFAIVGAYTISAIGTGGAIFLMFSHGLISGALFFLVGTLSDRYHTRAITAFSGLLGAMPLFSGFLIIAILANVGFPGTSGFVPELLVLISVVKGLPTVTTIILSGMIITAVSNLVIPLRVLFGHPRLLISRGS